MSVLHREEEKVSKEWQCLSSFQSIQEYKVAHLKLENQPIWMLRFGLWVNGEEKDVPRREETFKENYRFSKLEGTSVLKGLRQLGETRKAKQLAQRNPAREDSVLAWVPWRAKTWVQATCSGGDPRKQGLGRLRQGRRKSQAKMALPRSLLQATGTPSPKGPPEQYTQWPSGLFARRMRDRSIGLVRSCPRW